MKSRRVAILDEELQARHMTDAYEGMDKIKKPLSTLQTTVLY